MAQKVQHKNSLVNKELWPQQICNIKEETKFEDDSNQKMDMKHDTYSADY